MCSGDGLGGKPKSKEPKDIRSGTRTISSPERTKSESGGKAPEEMAMVDGPQGNVGDHHPKKGR